MTTAKVQATAAGPEIKDPMLKHQLMLVARARDATHWKELPSCLITRTTYQGLTELGGVLWSSSNVFCPLLIRMTRQAKVWTGMTWRGIAALPGRARPQ